MQRLRLVFWLALGLAWGISVAAEVNGQEAGVPIGGFPNGLGELGQLRSSEKPYAFNATYRVEEGGTRGELRVTATLDPEHYIYSTTQAPGGPLKTKISILSEGVTADGPAVANHEPKRIPGEDEGFDGIVIEKHFDEVAWTLPITFREPQKDSGREIEVKLSGQVCTSGLCTPVTSKLKATFEGHLASTKPKAAMEAFRDPKGNVHWTVQLDRSQAVAGDTLFLIFKAVPEPNYHVYAINHADTETAFRTNLAILEKGGLRFGMPTTDQPTEEAELPDGVKYAFHPGEVEWRVPIAIPEKAELGRRVIEGLMGYQACTAEICDQPLAFRFRGEVRIDQTSLSEPQPFSIEPVKFGEVAKALKNGSFVDGTNERLIPKVGSKEKESTTVAQLSAIQLLPYLGLAMLGGFVLNFMPCVLPVIGLKVMGFIEEGSGNPKRVAWLNFWYILGIMAFMMGLGLVTVLVKMQTGEALKWGEQFNRFDLQLAVLVLVFAMALSFLGVWEIPIPGFATSKTSNQLMTKEGISGAFFKGALTTLLATPCTGPFLTTALTLALSQANWVILTIFFFIGLGLSAPYIVIALYPKSVQWLPKPGLWMDTLKQALAFPMLLATVFFLQAIDSELRIAALTTLIGVWFACWWVGKIPGWAEWTKKLTHWSAAIATSVVFGIASFHWLGPIEDPIQWQPYSEARLKQLTAEGKTVMIDFTANWCATCKFNLATAIETKKVAALIRENHVAPLLADWSDHSEEIGDKLSELQANGIPVLAIYPSGQSEEPIILPALLRESTVLKALKDAGPSRSSPQSVAIAK